MHARSSAAIRREQSLTRASVARANSTSDSESADGEWSLPRVVQSSVQVLAVSGGDMSVAICELEPPLLDFLVLSPPPSVSCPNKSRSPVPVMSLSRRWSLSPLRVRCRLCCLQPGPGVHLLPRPCQPLLTSPHFSCRPRPAALPLSLCLPSSLTPFLRRPLPRGTSLSQAATLSWRFFASLCARLVFRRSEFDHSSSYFSYFHLLLSAVYF